MTTNIINCPRCGRIFARGLYDVCRNCMKDIEKEYERCAEYLRENRGATIHELSEATEVPVRQITKFIREGRISMLDTPNLGYPCESCGAQIRQGNLCDNCRNKFINQAKRIQERLKPEDTAKQQPGSGSAYEIKSKD